MLKRPRARLLALLSLASAVALTPSCGGGASLEPRYVAVHNAMAAMGLSQTGSISEGSLPEGAEARITTAMVGGTCYTVLGLGMGGVANVDVAVLDAAGTEVAHDSSTDTHAAVQYCPSYAGDYTVVVRMARGSGGYILSSWSGGTAGAAAGSGYYDPYGGSGYYDPYGSGGYGTTASTYRAPHGGPGTCEEPYELAVGAPIRGDSTNGDMEMTGSCLVGGTAPEQVYWFEVAERSIVTATMSSMYDGALYILAQCGDVASELGCNDDAPTTTRSEVRAILDPGMYYLVADGFGANYGEYEVSVATEPMRSTAEVCASVGTLTPGMPVAGSTTGGASYFAGTCGGGSEGADAVYALDVPSASRLRLRMQSTHDATLHVRTTCGDGASEVACNDNFGDATHSLVNMSVTPGRYYVIADGASDDEAGDFSLSAELAPPGGSPGGPGDTCGTALPLTSGTTELAADTFTAADDLRGSCGGAGAPDTVYRIDLTSRTRLRASFTDAEYPPVAYLRSTCGDTTTELGCAAPAATSPTPTTELDETLAAGTYYLVVDGTRADTFGSASMSLRMDDLGALDAACRGAPLIRPGTQIEGDTTGGTDRFQATCAGGALSPDLVYRLVIRRTSTVRISSEQAEWDGAIYIRSDCVDATTERGCNDDAGDNRHSMIETELEAGTYYVFVDGFASGNAGDFTLDVEVTAAP